MTVVQTQEGDPAVTAHSNGTVTALPLSTPDVGKPAAPVQPITKPADAMPDVQEQARQAYRQSLADEKPLSGKALGAMFERGERWGRDRIGEVKNAAVPTQKAPPALPKRPSKPAPVVTAPSTTRKPEKPAAPEMQEESSAETAPGGRLVSWVGFVFGSIMSVAANVLHTWLPVSVMPLGWSPGIASQVGAAVWPIGLLLSVEVLSRVKWHAGIWWSLARYGGAGTVALGSGVISYGHLRDVLAAWGYGTLAAHVGPLVLDGLMVISGFALLAMSTRHNGNKGAA